MKTTKIYVLIDPRDNSIRYVGKTNNEKERYKNHLNSLRDKNTHKRNWINQLKSIGLKPIMKVIEEIEIDKWKERESFYINHYKLLGFKLTNCSDGGEGLIKANKTSFKKNNNGLKIVALQKDGTYFNRYDSIREAKRQLGVHPNNIYSVITKKTKTAGGFIWVKEDEYDVMSSTEINKLVEFSNNNKEKGGKKTRFKVGMKSWNSGKRGIKLKPDKNVHQYTLDRVFIKTWSTAKKAANELNANEESIGQCARGKYKSAGGFYWSYNLL